MQKNISDLKKKSKPLIALETFSLNVSHKISLMNYCLVTTFSAIFFFLTVKAVRLPQEVASYSLNYAPTTINSLSPNIQAPL